MQKLKTFSLRFAFIAISLVLQSGYDEARVLPEKEKKETVRVAVFNGHGALPRCIDDTIEALKIDSAITPIILSAGDILRNKLKEVDVLIFPGGSGSQQMSNLGDLAAKKVKIFLEKEGKGIVGICAGAYLLSDTPDYPCMHLCAVEGIDREHDERGHGIVAFEVSDKDTDIFPELKDIKRAYLHYYEGPLLVPSRKNQPIPYQVIGAMISDVALDNNAPQGMTPGKPMFIAANAGKGRLFLSVAHPETTPGMRWILPRMVRWVAKKELISYPAPVVRPGIYTKEILFDRNLQTLEKDSLDSLLYGTPQEKITALETLVEIKSWSGRYWIPGLLRNADPKVRQEAAKSLAKLEQTAAIKDLQASIAEEQNNETKLIMLTALENLQAMIGH